MTHGPRPRVTLKIAQSLDGRIATVSGQSRWVTGPASRVVAHELRAAHDAILVGIGTVLADNPELTVRLTGGTNPIRVVVDSSLRTPPDAALFARDGTSVIVLTLLAVNTERADAVRAAGAEVVTVPVYKGRVDLGVGLEALYRRGVRSVLVEGGAQIATDVIRRRLCDELAVFIAPKIVGSGLDAVGDLGTTEMSAAVQLSKPTIRFLDGDVLYRAKPEWPTE
jgi:diaminohydroxyphosphoribosylaminopyrimidine deaminase / 5-amino-6-(5-phosphoribosylamino)uracil reductase